MGNPSALESLRYALEVEFIKLYITILLGTWALVIGPGLFGFIYYVPLRNLLKLPIIVAGVLLVAGGTVGVLHRIHQTPNGNL